jgi:hypothetical protein
MALQQPTIIDIQTTDLLYYDDRYKGVCYRFCEDRDIDFLPNATDQAKSYQRDKDKRKFEERPITDEERLDVTTYIFQPELRERFEQTPVQFVFANGVLTGVVHFSDYNREVVYTYLYAEIARYERDLRDLLVAYGLKNEDMRAQFQEIVDKRRDNPEEKDTVRSYERKLESFDREQETLTKLPEFQGFYLDDLRMLAKKQCDIKLSDVGKLRNDVMHARDSVEQRAAVAPDFIYEIESFVSFFGRVQALLQDRRRVQTRLQLKRWETAANSA